MPLADAARLAYLYSYPLASMEITRRQNTIVPTDDGSVAVGKFLLQGAPVNRIARVPVVPDAAFRSVVRPNVDTLYTNTFFDVSAQPLVVTVPDMPGRFHLFQVMDMWMDVAAAPGTRTLPDEKGYRFAIVGPHWTGTVPAGVHRYDVATDVGWMLGRIELEDRSDLDAVHALQEQVTVELLDGSPPPPTVPDEDPVSLELRVPDVLHAMTAQEYWDFYLGCPSHDQPRPGDEELLADLARHGWTPSERFDVTALSCADRAVWQDAWERTKADVRRPVGDEIVNGWRIARSGLGTYGTDYELRAEVAFSLFAANLPQDAVYPSTSVDGSGAALNSTNEYLVHFAPDEIPPVDAFWSMTIYDQDGFLVPNRSRTYSVRGELVTPAADGSVDVLISSQDPGPDTNWLPAPEAAPFTLTLRLYLPDDRVLDGTWNPPAVTPIPPGGTP